MPHPLAWVDGVNASARPGALIHFRSSANRYRTAYDVKVSHQYWFVAIGADCQTSQGPLADVGITVWSARGVADDRYSGHKGTVAFLALTHELDS